jgi:hypothetical protein
MSYENHQALTGLTLGKSTDYRDTYDASLLQGVPRSLNRDPLGLHADACRSRRRYLDAVRTLLAERARPAAGGRGPR